MDGPLTRFSGMTSTAFPADGPPTSKTLQGRYRAPTIKQHLAAIRRLFDWLVYGEESPFSSSSTRPTVFAPPPVVWRVGLTVFLSAPSSGDHCDVYAWLDSDNVAHPSFSRRDCEGYPEVPPGLSDRLAAELRCIPVVDHAAWFLGPWLPCRCSAACGDVGTARSDVSIISTGRAPR